MEDTDTDLPGTPGAVIQACKQARAWLREDHGISQLAEFKARSTRIYSNAPQKKFPPEAVMAAQEIVRRAERQIGVAIRRGQDKAEISPTDFISKGEWYGGGHDGGRNGMYALADVTDEAFEEAIKLARAHGDLTRINVIRNLPGGQRQRSDDWIPGFADRRPDASARRRELIRDWAQQGYSSRQISERLNINDGTIRRIARGMGVTIKADTLINKTRIHDQNRIIREAAHSLDAIVMGLDLVDPKTIDPDEKEASLPSLIKSAQRLNRFLNQAKKATNGS
jgi:hypothetical protein